MSTNFDEITGRMLEEGRLKNFSALAVDLGITPQAISNYRKRGEIPTKLVLKFAEKYEVSLDWLFTGTGIPSVGIVEFLAVEKLLKIMRSGDQRIVDHVNNVLEGSVRIIDIKEAGH